jgi:guanosine-3',5'-bis(diphosphate) 3'-pyrophosphohydrolase
MKLPKKVLRRTGNTKNHQQIAALTNGYKRYAKCLKTQTRTRLTFLDDFKMNLFSDEIFIFTPKGALIQLPLNATALDFAFEIHTDVGASCIGAKVNHKLVPLSYKLQNGDQVE